MSRFAASIIAPAGAIVLLFNSRGPMHLSRSRRLITAGLGRASFLKNSS